MDTATANVLCATAFVDELWRSGVAHICLCPGSRSTPLAVAFGRHPCVRTWVHVDERSAGYFAIGLAKAEGRAVALLCTSGTAAANFMPALVEASLAGVPLIVLTADRPPELHHVGANQTIDQLKLYGSHARWSVQMPLPESRRDVVVYFRTIARRAVDESQADPPAPVHLNFPFREPFLPAAVAPASPARAADRAEAGARASPAAGAWPREVTAHPPADIEAVLEDVASASRGLIVCGPQPDVEAAASLRRLSAFTGFPILADPLSQVRFGGDHGAATIDRYDAFLRDERATSALVPDVVLRLGATPTSKPLLQYLERHVGTRQVLVHRGLWNDPMLIATMTVDAGIAAFVGALLPALERRREVADAAGRGPGERRAWTERWRRINRAAGAAIAAAFERSSEMFEGRVFAELSRALPPGSCLFLGNSMPVRDADAFLPARAEPLRVFGNRGASGIDGVVSTALGVAAAGERVTLVVGDLSFYHDLNGLLAAKLHGLSLTVVLVNNDGGGIFSFLPQADTADQFERLFGTPHGLEFRHAVAMYGGAYARAETWQDFRDAVATAQPGGGLHVLEVRTDRRRNVHQHRDVWRRVADAIAPELVAASGAAL